MARSEKQELIAQLTLQDQLSGPLAAAKQNLIQTDNTLARIGTTAKASGASLGGLSASLSSVAKIGAGAFLGFTALNAATDFLTSSVEAARQDEESISKLTATLKANTPAWQDDQAAIEAHIQASTAAAFSDDELRQSLATLATGTHDVQKAFADQALAIDLARFSNSSLQEASQQLVAVEAGRFRGLAQLGINIKGITTAEEALARIRETVAGQGQAFLETDAGRAEQAKIALDELSESAGRLISGPLSQVSTVLADAFNVANGVAAEKINTQGQAIATQAAEFVKTATLAQLQGARDATAQQIEKLNAQLQASASIPVIGQLSTPEQVAGLQRLQDVLNTLDRGINAFGADLGSGAESLRGAANDANKLGDAYAGASGPIDDATQKLIDNALAAGQAADAHARLTDPLGLVADHFGALSDNSLLAGNSLDAATVAAQGANASVFDVGNAASTAGGQFDELAFGINAASVQLSQFQQLERAGVGLGTSGLTPAQGAISGNVGTSVNLPPPPPTQQPFTNLPTTVGSTNQQLRDLKQNIIDTGKALHDNTNPADVQKLEVAYRNAKEALANFQQQQRDQASAKALAAANEAAAKAKQRAEELARAYKEKVSLEFDRAKKTADALFDSLHKRVDQAIDDAEKLAQKNHDAAVQAIADNLKAEEAKHAAPVNAAESALAATQVEEQRRNLVEAQQAAAAAQQANRDPAQAADLARALRDATEALANFDAQAAIDRLKAVQAGLDAASEASAKTQTAAADAKLQAAKDEAQKERDAETLAAKKRKDDFETQLAALEKRDIAANKPQKQIDADIAALEKRFGITTDTLGFHHIDDPLVTAIKNVKIDPPQVTVINNQKFLLQVGPNELRLIASAISSGNQPAATSSVRTGANGRG